MVSFDTTHATGDHIKAGETVAITATMSEAVQEGGQITVNLSSGGSAVLTADTEGTTLSGTYTVLASENADTLAVDTIVLNGSAPVDLAGNVMTDKTVPVAADLSASTIVVDTKLARWSKSIRSTRSATARSRSGVPQREGDRDVVLSFSADDGGNDHQVLTVTADGDGVWSYDLTNDDMLAIGQGGGPTCYCALRSTRRVTSGHRPVPPSLGGTRPPTARRMRSPTRSRTRAHRLDGSVITGDGGAFADGGNTLDLSQVSRDVRVDLKARTATHHGG